MAISRAAQEIRWLTSLLKELNMKNKVNVYTDNQAALAISKNDLYHDRTKHIDIRHHFVREMVENGEIDMKWIPSRDQLADIFTKPLGKNIFEDLRFRIMKE